MGYCSCVKKIDSQYFAKLSTPIKLTGMFDTVHCQPLPRNDFSQTGVYD